MGFLLNRDMVEMNRFGFCLMLMIQRSHLFVDLVLLLLFVDCFLSLFFFLSI